MAMDTEQTLKMTAKLPPALKWVRSTAKWTISVQRLFLATRLIKFSVNSLICCIATKKTCVLRVYPYNSSHAALQHRFSSDAPMVSPSL